MARIPLRTKPGRTRGPVRIPDELRQAFARDERAWVRFEGLPLSHQREVVGYVAEAKKTQTRERRAARTVVDVKAGKIGSA